MQNKLYFLLLIGIFDFSFIKSQDTDLSNMYNKLLHAQKFVDRVTFIDVDNCGRFFTTSDNTDIYKQAVSSRDKILKEFFIVRDNLGLQSLDFFTRQMMHNNADQCGIENSVFDNSAQEDIFYRFHLSKKISYKDASIIACKAVIGVVCNLKKSLYDNFISNKNVNDEKSLSAAFKENWIF